MDFNKKKKINLGSIYGKYYEDFRYNINFIIDKFSKDNKYNNSELCFYVYCITYYGDEVRVMSNKHELLKLKGFNNDNEFNSRLEDTTNTKILFLDDLDNIDNIIKILSDKYDRLDDIIERDYKRDNNLGEYYSEEFDDGNCIDYFESLDPTVYVDVINT